MQADLQAKVRSQEGIIKRLQESETHLSTVLDGKSKELQNARSDHARAMEEMKVPFVAAEPLVWYWSEHVT